MFKSIKNPKAALFLANLLTVILALTLAVITFNSIDMDSTTTNRDVVRFIASLWWLYIGSNAIKSRSG